MKACLKRHRWNILAISALIVVLITRYAWFHYISYEAWYNRLDPVDRWTASELQTDYGKVQGFMNLAREYMNEAPDFETRSEWLDIYAESESIADTIKETYRSLGFYGRIDQ